MPQPPPSPAPGGRRSGKFGRSKRLPGGAEFHHVLKEGKILRGDFILLKVSPNGRVVSRFACSVRKGAVRKAVSRNQLKRWLREAFRTRDQSDPEGLDWIATVARVPEDLSYHAVNKELIDLCTRLSARFS